MRKVIAIILLVAAAAGLVYGILGVTQKTVKVKSGEIEGVYNFAENSYDGTMAWSSAGGYQPPQIAAHPRSGGYQPPQIAA